MAEGLPPPTDTRRLAEARADRGISHTPQPRAGAIEDGREEEPAPTVSAPRLSSDADRKLGRQATSQASGLGSVGRATPPRGSWSQAGGLTDRGDNRTAKERRGSSGLCLPASDNTTRRLKGAPQGRRALGSPRGVPGGRRSMGPACQAHLSAGQPGLRVPELGHLEAAHGGGDRECGSFADQGVGSQVHCKNPRPPAPPAALRLRTRPDTPGQSQPAPAGWAPPPTPLFLCARCPPRPPTNRC